MPSCFLCCFCSLPFIVFPQRQSKSGLSREFYTNVTRIKSVALTLQEVQKKLEEQMKEFEKQKEEQEKRIKNYEEELEKVKKELREPPKSPQEDKLYVSAEEREKTQMLVCEAEMILASLENASTPRKRSSTLDVSTPPTLSVSEPKAKAGDNLMSLFTPPSQSETSSTPVQGGSQMRRTGAHRARLSQSSK